ncbi:MAG: amidohydrolase family protein [Myxococcota bacterium]
MTASGSMITDVHAHHFSRELLGFLGRAGIPLAAGRGALRTRSPIPMLPFEARLPMMAEAGVGRQILSSALCAYALDPALGREGARLVNDELARFCADRREQFSFWAALPLPHVEPSLAEIARAFDELGALGVILHCSCLGDSIARAEFDPVYAELDRRHAVVFLHPCQDGIGSRALNDWSLTVCAGASFEDTVAALHLIARQVPRRFPKLRFIVPHFGGLLPTLLARLDGQMPQDDFAEPPSATARRFFYDTVGWGSKPALLAAVAAFGAGQLVPGSDYPVLLPSESYAQTFAHVREAGLPESDVDRILYRNAPKLLGLAR